MEGLRINSIQQVLQEVGVSALPGEKLTVMPGDTLRVRATVDYRGPDMSDTFYGAIGNREFYGFDEVAGAHGSTPIYFPESMDWVGYELTVDIPVPARAGLFDLYVKISGHLEAGLPEVSDVIEVLGIAEFQNFKIIGYDKV